ncbi:MAG: LamG domain-containing protein [Gammaproteobacteria bacterium]|nr:LamG domain-containing protein [Gammaproteobacteria bacterium]
MKNAGYGAQEGIAALIQQGFALTNNNPGYGLVPGDSNPTPPIVSRYFAWNETTRYATIPEVTLAGDFVIEFDIYRDSSAGSAGQFPFASYDNGGSAYGLSVYTTGDWVGGEGFISLFGFTTETSAITGMASNIFYKIKYAYLKGVLKSYLNGVLVNTAASTPPAGIGAATASSICRAAQGGFNFSGIIANLSIYDNGTLIRDYPIDDDSNTLVDHASGQNGTVINGIQADWGDFVQEGANWRGQDLTVPPWESTNQLLEVAVPAEHRYFALNETTRYATIPEVTLAGDCVISFQVLSSDAASPQIIVGNSIGTINSIFINTNDIFIRDSDGVTINTTGDAIQSNILSEVEIVVIANNVEIFVNGVSRASGAKTGALTFNQVYTRQSGSMSLIGILANLKIYDDGTLIRDYPINDDSDILRNRATVLGPELWENPNLVGGASYDAGVLSISTTGNKAGGEVFVPAGTHAVMSFDVELTEGELELSVLANLVGTIAGSNISSSGRYTFLIDSSDTIGIKRVFGVGSVVATVSNISIRQADGYGAVINGIEADWGDFVQEGINWRGQGLTVPPWESTNQLLEVAG